MGVEYNLFWTLNPKTFKPFVKAFYLKKQQDDTFAWLQGSYIMEAIGATMSKNHKYPTQPRSANGEIDIDSSETVEEKRYNRMKEAILRDVEIFNKRFEKKGG